MNIERLRGICNALHAHCTYYSNPLIDGRSEFCRTTRSESDDYIHSRYANLIRSVDPSEFGEFLEIDATFSPIMFVRRCSEPSASVASQHASNFLVNIAILTTTKHPN